MKALAFIFLVGLFILSNYLITLEDTTLVITGYVLLFITLILMGAIFGIDLSDFTD